MERVKTCGECHLHAAQQGIDESQLDTDCAGVIASRPVSETDGREALASRQAVASPLDQSAQGHVGPPPEAVLGEDELLQATPSRLTNYRGVQGRDDVLLVFRALTSLAPGRAPAHVALIRSDAVVWMAAAFSHVHDLQQFLHVPSGDFISNNRLALEPRPGDISIGLSKEIHGAEPSGQHTGGGSPGGRASVDGGLLATGRALPVGPTIRQRRCCGEIRHAGGRRTVRPARLHLGGVSQSLFSIACRGLRLRQMLPRLEIADGDFEFLALPIFPASRHAGSMGASLGHRNTEVSQTLVDPSCMTKN